MEKSAGGDRSSSAKDETLTDSGFYWRGRGGVKVLVCRSLEEAGFANGFSTRHGGVSSLEGSGGGSELNLGGFNEDRRENIYENRGRFLAVFDRSYRLGLAWQVHGDHVRVVENLRDADDSDERADALISDVEGVLVGVKTADCVPVIIGDRRTGAFAAIHAGWRGTVQSIVSKAVNAMTMRFGSRPADLICVIGPAAGCDRYEVGEEVVREFAKQFSTCGNYFRETRPGHATVDLKAANRDQLTAAGVAVENIHISGLCTMERADLFFSYRIEKSKFGRTGRLLSVIGKL